VLLAVFVLISTPDAFADHKSVTVQNAQGSSVPGCEPNCFVPSSVTIDVGGMVTWENNDSAAHTSTSGTPSDGADGMWDSSLVMSGQSYSVNLYTQGSHPYFCMVHPWMTGVVNVTADSSPPPPPPVTPSPPSPPRGTDITVGVGTSTPGCEFSNSCYTPSTYRVKSGSEISWYNADTAAHTVTAGNPADGPSGMFDSGLFMSGQSYSIKLDRAGTYDYFCMVHPWMLGTVVVSGGSSPSTPTPSSTVSSLSVSTYSRSYDVGDKVTLDMNLNGAGSGENIAISVQNPNGNVILSRTATTNSAGQANIQFKIGDEYTQGSYDVKVTSSVSGKTFSDSLKFMVNASGGITITSVQPTDQQGNPVSSFSKGKLGFVKVILSADSNTKSLVTVNLFDSDLTSLGIGSFKTTLTAGQSEMVLSFFIPDDAEFGTGEIFANAFTNWPSQGGTPLTGESSTSVRLQ